MRINKNHRQCSSRWGCEAWTCYCFFYTIRNLSVRDTHPLVTREVDEGTTAANLLTVQILATGLFIACRSVFMVVAPGTMLRALGPTMQSALS